MDDRLLTFELEREQGLLAIHGSPHELEALARRLLGLVAATRPGHFEHDHFTTEEWGGSDLTSQKQSESSELIQHVKVYCWRVENRSEDKQRAAL